MRQQRLLYPSLSEGLGGAWCPSLGATGGRLIDQSGFGNHGVLTNMDPATDWVATEKGLSLDLNGTNKTVEIPNRGNLQLIKFSLGAWVKFHTDPSNNPRIISKNSSGSWYEANYCIYYDSGYDSFATSFYDNVDFRTTLASYYPAPHTKGWFHVVATYDKVFLKLFINGSEIGSTAFTSTPNTSSGSLFLGSGLYSGSTDTLNGQIAEASVYNRALSQSEISLLAQRPGIAYEVQRRRSVRGATLGPVYDAVSNSGYQSASSSYSWSHTCTGSNRFLAVDISMLSVPGTTVTGITYNGVALSFIGAKSTVSGAGRVESWGLVAPATGSNTIAVTLSASIISSGEAVSYTNVQQTSPTESYNSAQATNVGAADATVTITSATNNCLIRAAVVADDSSITANQTSRNNVSGAGGSGGNEDNTVVTTTAGAVTLSYTGVGALATWAIGGYAVRPVGAANLATTLTADFASFTITAQAANLTANRLITAAVSSYTVSAQDAGLTAQRRITCDVASFVISAQDTNLIASRMLTAEVATFTVSAQDAGLTKGVRLTADVASFTISEQDAGLTAQRRLTADVATFAITAQDTNLTLQGQTILDADVVSYTISAQDVTLTKGVRLTADVMSIVISAQDVGLRASRTITCGVASYVISAQAATLTYNVSGGSSNLGYLHYYQMVLGSY